MFSNALEDAFENKAEKNHAEAKPYDVVMMFKIMVTSIIISATIRCNTRI